MQNCRHIAVIAIVYLLYHDNACTRTVIRHLLLALCPLSEIYNFNMRSTVLNHSTNLTSKRMKQLVSLKTCSTISRSYRFYMCGAATYYSMSDFQMMSMVRVLIRLRMLWQHLVDGSTPRQAGNVTTLLNPLWYHVHFSPACVC